MSMTDDLNARSSSSNESGVTPERTEPRSRPLGRRVLHVIRRTHLYIGVFLFPWAMLYGVTGFLFNHPTFFADSLAISFSPEDLKGTELESLPDLPTQAQAVVAALNESQKPTTPYKLAEGKISYANREAFVATAKAGSRSFFVTFDPLVSKGLIRESTPAVPPPEPAPFATAKPEGPRQRGMGMSGPMPHESKGLKISDSIVERLKKSLPVVMERKGIPSAEVTLTTAPDIRFPMDVDGKTWTATFNPLTTAVTGVNGQRGTNLTLRTFLLRMHLTRGYPSEINLKWGWAIGVDGIALALCFWGISGILMWWQIKSTRRAGLVVLVVSSILATMLTVGMHQMFTA
ncbi:MAG: PepSY domain-containing protein [Planctomycetaceae bacterium]